jgi:hypothetical protein
MQQFLKAFCRAARARIVPAEFFVEFFVSMNDPDAALHMSLGREAAAPFTGALESRAGQSDRDAWDTSR